MSLPLADRETTLPLARLVARRHRALGERLGEPLARGARPGPFPGSRRGHGMDFDDLRPYVAGDDARHIDWRTSARRNAVHTRLYREEKDHPVTVVVDLRATMFTGSSRLRAVCAGETAADLLWRAASGGHRTGLVTLRERGLGFSRPAHGTRGALDGCRVLAEAFNEARRQAGPPASYPPPGGTDGTLSAPTLDRMLDELLHASGRQGASILASGLDDPGDALQAALRRHALARALAIVQIRDPLERDSLPVGRYRYRGQAGPTTVTLDRRSRQRVSDSLALIQSRKQQLCDEAGVLLIDADTAPAEIIGRLRERGLLA